MSGSGVAGARWETQPAPDTAYYVADGDMGAVRTVKPVTDSVGRFDARGAPPEYLGQSRRPHTPCYRDERPYDVPPRQEGVRAATTATKGAAAAADPFDVIAKMDDEEFAAAVRRREATRRQEAADRELAESIQRQEWEARERRRHDSRRYGQRHTGEQYPVEDRVTPAGPTVPSVRVWPPLSREEILAFDERKGLDYDRTREYDLRERAASQGDTVREMSARDGSAEYAAQRGFLRLAAATALRTTDPIAKFDGDYTKFGDWLDDFLQLVENQDLDIRLKWNKLVEALEGIPKSFVEEFKGMSRLQGYAGLIGKLRYEYGRPHLIRAAWLKRLRDFVPADPARTHRELVDATKSCMRALERTDAAHELNGEDMVGAVLSLCPPNVQREFSKEQLYWREEKGRSAPMRVVLRLLERHVKMEEDPMYGRKFKEASRVQFRDRKRQLEAPSQHLPPQKRRRPNRGHTAAIEEDGTVAAARAHPPPSQPSLSSARPHKHRGHKHKKEKKSKGKHEGSSRGPTGTASVAAPAPPHTAPKPHRSDRKCSICGQTGHEALQCTTMVPLTVEVRVGKLRQMKLCFSCLEPGHMIRDCMAGLRCTVPGCNDKHAALVHGYSGRRQTEFDRAGNVGGTGGYGGRQRPQRM